MYEKENQQPVPGGGQDLQNIPGLNPGYMQYGPIRQYGGGPTQSAVPGHGRSQFYADPVYGHLSPSSALSMHNVQFPHGNSPGHTLNGPGMIDPQSWAPVANVVSQEQVQEMYQTILGLKQQQDAKIQEYEEAIRVRDQFLEEFRQTKDALQQYAAVGALPPSIKNRQNTALAQAMRSVMLELLYLEGIDENSDEAKDKHLLPTPLTLGEEPRKAPDGSRVWNPDWYAGPTQGSINPQYIGTAIKLLKIREEKSTSSAIDSNILNDTTRLKQAASTYFTSLRKRYKGQATEAGKAQRERIKGTNKLRGRKRAKAAAMRTAVALAEAAQGRENTVGYMEIIHTDWMSSEHSDCGKMDPMDFKRYRQQKIGSNSGWEVRTLRWRAKKLMRLYLYLRKLMRDQKASITEPSHKKNGNVPRTTRFPGTPINANDRTPTVIGQTKALPYKSCINQGWARRTGNHDLIVETDPAHFTVFDLEIADDLLDDEDLGYLAAHEDD